jgi:anionic cell wall polymer biosynthesis LytR-Cps2A-Psr (LCP) family protein
MNKYKKKKLIILIIIYLLLALLLFLSLWSIFRNNKDISHNPIYAGIGGAVNDRGVYEIDQETRLYELILKAKGLHKRADIRNIDTDLKVIPWEVYCIPYLPEKIYKQVPSKKIPQPKTHEIKLPQSMKKISIVYAGLPRTYMLITIIPELELITITHIPWYSRVTPEYEYPRSLYEIYLTGGVPFLGRAVKMITRETIDYYFTQKRPSWINFIDYLGGIEVKVPDEFAIEYGLPKGVNNLNGILAWEYISFISKSKRREGQIITGSLKRIEMQKEFMQSMYRKFSDSNFYLQGEILTNIMKEAETNMTTQDYLKLVQIYRKMKNPKLKLLTLPGVIQYYNGVEMYVPDLDGYEIEKKNVYLRSINELK